MRIAQISPLGRRGGSASPPGLDRRTVRAVFERRFTAARMARDFIAIYRRLLADGRWPRAINRSQAIDEAMQ